MKCRMRCLSQKTNSTILGISFWKAAQIHGYMVSNAMLVNAVMIAHNAAGVGQKALMLAMRVLLVNVPTLMTKNAMAEIVPLLQYL